jgi:hypothetical protein
MPRLKAYNTATSQWEYIAVGGQGPIGLTGPTGATGATGAGFPVGGTAGQVLVKLSATNYDTAWSEDAVDPTPKIFLLMGA